MSDIETQLRAAYAHDHLMVPESAIRPRVRRRRTRLALAAVLAVAAAAGASVWAAGAWRPRPDATIQATSDPAVRRALCDRKGAAELGAALPETVVTFADRGQWIELYLGDTALVSCMGPYEGFAGERGDSPGVLVEVTRSPYRSPQQAWFVGRAMTSIERTFHGGQSYRVVAMPDGTERAEMTAADGTKVPAVLAGGRAVSWLPVSSDAGVAGGGPVTAYTPNQTYTLAEGEVTVRPR